MEMKLTDKEAELIAHFRRISDFNRHRILAIARNALDDRTWAEKVRQNQESAPKSGETSNHR